jgi:GNAT superfamily N-acetyltransferase
MRRSVAEVVVMKAWRRRGIASALYAHVEAELGQPLRPSRIRTNAGKALWASRGHREWKKGDRPPSPEFGLLPAEREAWRAEERWHGGSI